jgi:hypothetical protein
VPSWQGIGGGGQCVTGGVPPQRPQVPAHGCPDAAGAGCLWHPQVQGVGTAQPSFSGPLSMTGPATVGSQPGSAAASQCNRTGLPAAKPGACGGAAQGDG